MSQKYLLNHLFLITLFRIFTSSLNAEQMTPISEVIVLHLSFADTDWDGKVIPNGQQCREFGGNGASRI